MGHGALRVDTSAFNGAAVVAVRVGVDAQTARALSKALDEIDDTAHAALDLSAVEFMDSSGLYALLLKAGAMRNKGGLLAIRSAPAHVRRLLHFTDLTSLLETNGGPTSDGEGTVSIDVEQ